jgi:hypothetical protein
MCLEHKIASLSYRILNQCHLICGLNDSYDLMSCFLSRILGIDSVRIIFCVMLLFSQLLCKNVCMMQLHVSIYTIDRLKVTIDPIHSYMHQLFV